MARYLLNEGSISEVDGIGDAMMIKMEMKTRPMTREAEFRLGDVPPARQFGVLRRITGNLELEGKIVDTVQLGEPPETYAMMEVRGLRTPMLVPMSALR